MSYENIPQTVSAALLSISDNPVVILILINVILLIVGIFMDMTPAVLIFTPIFLPITALFIAQGYLDPMGEHHKPNNRGINKLKSGKNALSF